MKISPVTKRIVRLVFEELYRRRGFNDWWDPIASDIKIEALRQLYKIVEELAEGGDK